ncbi:MAG: hypothetical protein ACAI44_06850 [Candidatus Sericytochromatia bacterium]
MSVCLLLQAACTAAPAQPLLADPSGQAESNFNLTHTLNWVQSSLPNLKQVYLADVGRGKQTPASFSVHIQYPEQPDQVAPFRTKASLNGVAGGKASDILAFRVFLVNSATPPAPGALTISSGPFTIAGNLSGGSQVVTFKNVFTGNFYVAVAAFNSSTVFNSTTNITNPGAAYTYTTEGRSYLSTSGGVAGFPGQVQVGAATAYIVTGTPQLQVNLTLTDAVGSQIDTLINVYNGGP